MLSSSEFNGRFFKQTSGLSMDSPLSPVFSNIFMELFERKYLKGIFEDFNITWLRYVDDIFATWNGNVSPDALLEIINSFVPTINFTVEKPQNNKLSFLDVTLNVSNSGFVEFNVYRKATHVNSYVHWFSSHSSYVKKGIVFGQFLRALRICSPRFLDYELNFIKKNILILKYPMYIIRRALREAKKKFYSPRKKESFNMKNVLSYPGNLNDIKEFKRYVPKDINLVQSVPCTLKKILKPILKEKNENMGVYKIKCRNCNKIYVGETTDFKRRKYQHSYSLRIDDQNSALTHHRAAENHHINMNDFSSVAIVQDSISRKLLESFIINNTNNINNSRGTFYLDTISDNFLKDVPAFKKILSRVSD